MTDSAQPFWEETYRSGAAAFSAEPNGTLKEFERLLSKGAVRRKSSALTLLPPTCGSFSLREATI